MTLCARTCSKQEDRKQEFAKVAEKIQGYRLFLFSPSLGDLSDLLFALPMFNLHCGQLPHGSRLAETLLQPYATPLNPIFILPSPRRGRGVGGEGASRSRAGPPILAELSRPPPRRAVPSPDRFSKNRKNGEKPWVNGSKSDEKPWKTVRQASTLTTAKLSPLVSRLNAGCTRHKKIELPKNYDPRRPERKPSVPLAS